MGFITNNWKMRILISLLVLTVTSKAYLFKANLHLEEEGTFYDQSEIYDPVTADVITIVPAHERQGVHLEELKRIENEGLGISIWKLKNENICHIEALDENAHPLMFVLKVASFEAENITVSNNMLDIVYVLNQDTGVWDGNVDDLTENMQTMCEGLEIRKVKEKALTVEEFNELLNGEGGRKKRRVPIPMEMQIAVSCYDRFGCWHCGNDDGTLLARKRRNALTTTTEQPFNPNMTHVISISQLPLTMG